MKQILGFPNYWATECGDIYKNKDRKLGQSVATNHYLMVTVYDATGKRFYKTVHSLMMLAYVGKRPLNNYVRHLDGDRMNNNISNLAYGTPKENAEDDKRNGVSNAGSRHGLAKMTEEEVIAIREEYARGGVTQVQIANRLGKHPVYIGQLIRRTIWKHI